MSSKIVHKNACSINGTANGTTKTALFEVVSSLDDCDSRRVDIYGNVSQYDEQHSSIHNSQKSIIYDVPKSNECIYAQPKSNVAVSVDSLIPQAAKLILAQTPKTKNDLVEEDNSTSEDFEYTVDDSEQENSSLQSDFDFYADDFRDSSYNDFGLEVIQEETESQMSSDSDQELEQCAEFCSETIRQRKLSVNEHMNHFDVTDYDHSTNNLMGYSVDTEIDDEQETSCPDEIITKHIRIPNEWDPEPLLKRLYTMCEPKQVSHGNSPNDLMAGHLNILSGNRKKGTFWNAWRKKYFVVASGKISGYEKEDCQDIFQSINLIGGSVDFLDPTEFVGKEQSKCMTNRIIGVDDGKGHYYVFQCPSAADAGRWVAALQEELLSSVTFSTPILPNNPSTFRDIFLIDLGSTNIRAGVLTHQPTLPAVFFGAVMSENIETGRVIYGNDVYLPENRKKSKIKFPFECTSKLCQNTLDVGAIKGFLLKIFKQMNIKPENYRVIMNLPRKVDSICRKSILQLFFHTFQVRSALLCHQSVMSFWAYSADNGIVCDVGERCDIVPVSQGFVLSHAWGRTPLGGQPLKHALRQGLGPQENGLYLSTPAENLVLRFISENFICINGGGTRKLSQDSQEIVVEMDLRDVLSFSNLIGVNQDVLRGVGEGLFDPGHYGQDCDGIAKVVYKSLQDCGVDIRKEMSQNLFLVGGCTLIPGFAERLQFELTKLCPPHLKPKVQASPYRYHASYIGASVLASTEAFEKSLLLRVKYDDGQGPSHWLI